MNTYFADIPKHKYCYVISDYVSYEENELWPCIWFGITTQVGRAFGLNVLLESGAIYRNVPPHAIRFNNKKPINNWQINQAQLWDCYSQQFAVIEYKYLKNMQALAKIGLDQYYGDYIFTVAFLNDGFSEHPEQNKEFHFLEMDNGCLTIQPTNRVLFNDKSFVETLQFPTNLKLQSTVWSCE